MKRICFFFLLVLANFYSFAQVDSFRPVYDEEKQDFYNMHYGSGADGHGRQFPLGRAVSAKRDLGTWHIVACKY